jgi:hypothetical protein
LEKTHHKERAGRVVQGIGPEFKPCTEEKNKNKKPWVITCYWCNTGGDIDAGTELPY